MPSGLSPFEQVQFFFPDGQDFAIEIENYLRAGFVFSDQEKFILAKQIDSSEEAPGQWFAEKPDTWYVRWASGSGALKNMMNTVKPLRYVMFQRVTRNGMTEMRKYLWDRLYKLVGGND